MSNLSKIKSAASIKDVAVLLGFKPSALAYVLYKIPESKKYSEFEIPKRNGGKRLIKAPVPSLKQAQRRLANLLYSCIAEIEKTPPLRRPLSHGFSENRSIITNAERHRNQRYVFNVDIEDFFPSINFGRVRGFFIKDNDFRLNPKVATVVAQLACHENQLPQGSPCSPVISNLIGKLLDASMVRLAKRNQCTYSRYADDLTFSTNKRDFPEEIAMPDSSARGGWVSGKRLTDQVISAGFALNSKKTRMQVRGSRQLATGLLVNKKVNVRPEYYRTVRAMCATLFSTGTYYRMKPASLEGGEVSDPPVRVVETSLLPLAGMFAHVYNVKDYADRRDRIDKKKEPTACRSLYQKFLHFKNFCALQSALIVTEGKTDQVYLRAAIEMLPAFHPSLGAFTAGGPFRLAFKFMKYGSTAHEILQIGGGSGDLKYLIINHAAYMPRFVGTTPAHPVIIVVDNDQGAKDVFSVAKSHGASKISFVSAEDFYHLGHNLYLVKTPSTSAKEETSIEDLFASSLLATKVDGKSFDVNKTHGDTTSYGKHVFAERVVKPNKETIDFSGFSPLLSRIQGAIEDYKAKLMPQPM